MTTIEELEARIAALEQVNAKLEQGASLILNVPPNVRWWGWRGLHVFERTAAECSKGQKARGQRGEAHGVGPSVQECPQCLRFRPQARDLGLRCLKLGVNRAPNPAV